MPADQNEVVFREKVRLLYSLLPAGLAATVINCSIVTFLHWHLVPRTVLLSWAGALIGLSLVRGLAYVVFLRASLTSANCRFRQKLFGAGMLVTGLVWGLAALFSIFHHSEPHVLLIAYVIGGMVAGVAGMFAAFRINYYGFACAAVLPQIVIFLIRGSPTDLAMAGMFGLFVLVISFSAESNHRIITSSFRLGQEKNALIQSLYKEKESTEAAYRLLAEENERRRQSEGQLQLARDELERKVAERTTELSHANGELRKSAELYRSLVETSLEGIWVISTERTISYANSRMAQLLGYETSELLEQHLSHFVIADDLAYYAVETEISGIRQVHLRRRDGAIIQALEAASKLPLPLGRNGKLLCMVTDITEISDREAQIRRYAQALEERNRELDAFTHSVSHDLRTPLLTIMGFARLLSEESSGKLSAEAGDHLQRIINGTQKMNAIINDLLKLSRISRQEVCRADVDLSRLALTIVNELKKAFPQRYVRVHIHSDLHCQADQGLLSVALTNLLSNAWKYTAKSPQALVEVGALVRHDTTVYFVRDNGVGFEMAEAEKLFKPFQRLHPEKEFSGTGIGLVIVERVVRKHGGKIWVESAPGKGTTFYFQLTGGRQEE